VPKKHNTEPVLAVYMAY